MKTASGLWTDYVLFLCMLQTNSTPAWVYVLIVALLLIALAILALIAFLYTRRR